MPTATIHSVRVGFEVFGTVFGIDTDRPADIEEFRRRSGGVALPAEFDGAAFVCRIRDNLAEFDSVATKPLADGPARFDLIEDWLQKHLAKNARTRVLIHAGAVAVRGAAVLLPGSSGRGKSTLVESLVRAGAVYLSDEFAVLDPQGRTWPYPRPIARRAGRGLPAGRPTAEELGGTVAAGPFPVRVILHTVHRPGSVWNPMPLSPLWATSRLMTHCAGVRRNPEFATDCIQAAVTVSASFESPRGEAEEVVAWLLAGADGCIL